MDRIKVLKDKIKTVQELILSRKPTRVVYNTVKYFNEDNGFYHAAAVSFYFFLSFIPFLILLASLMGYSIEWIREYYDITLDEMIKIASQRITSFIPYMDQKTISSIFSITNYRAGMGQIGLLSLAVSASLLFSSLHYSFYTILGGKFMNFIITRAIGIIFLVALSIAIFFIHYLSSLVFSIVNTITSHIPYAEDLLHVLNKNGFTVSILLSTLMIILFFYLSIRIFTRKAGLLGNSIIWGALLFSLLWNAAKYFFNIYITKLASINVLYGSMAWIITMILWIYYSALVLFISLEFIKSLNEEKMKSIHNNGRTRQDII